jgi:hypothetical protein
MATKQHQSNTWVFVLLGVLLLAGIGFGIFTATADPCAGKRKKCYRDCPTVVVAKQVCREMCNLEYDQCRRKHRQGDDDDSDD